jgi:hypothetical protein
VELVAVIAVLTVVMSAITAILINAHWRLRRAARATAARAQVSRAAQFLSRDVRGAERAEVRGGELLLTGPGERAVKWVLRAGRLVRIRGETEEVFRAPVSRFTPRARGGLVEAGIEMRVRGRKRGTVTYAASRTRIAGGGTR